VLHRTRQPRRFVRPPEHLRELPCLDQRHDCPRSLAAHPVSGAKTAVWRESRRGVKPLSAKENSSREDPASEPVVDLAGTGGPGRARRWEIA
jgi:hypothetical protein